ncbi:MAG TPA: hypothetical protein VL981_10015 [Candidatus Methylacidiphilales bacterium]|nr:hypothetical protein [Candidatus Methylacidiphilales bacterium]
MLTPYARSEKSWDDSLDVEAEMADAEQFQDIGDYRSALVDYSKCYEKLEQLQKNNPGQPGDIAEQIKECRQAITKLKPLAAAQPASPKLGHAWDYIDYASYPSRDTKANQIPEPNFLLGFSGKSQGLRLDIHGPSRAFFETHHLTARLHRADGEVVHPIPEWEKSLNAPIGIRTAYEPKDNDWADWSAMTFFPWGPNTLEESWIEVTTGTERYWLEIPYGFDRNPQDTLPPSVSAGPPKIASVMEHLTSHDHVVPWQGVRYHLLDTIPEDWGLELDLSNSGICQSKLNLYAEHGEDRATPLGSSQILDLNGNATGIVGQAKGNRLFQYEGKSDGVRCWGQIEIAVKGKSYRLVIPSSLYKKTDGHAAIP